MTKDDRYLIAGLEDKSIKVWELKSQECIHTIKNAHKMPVVSLSLTSDDKTLYSTSEINIKKWDL